MIRVSSGGSNYDTGLTHVSTTGVVTTGSGAQAKESGVLYWKVPFDLIGLTYVYQCQAHSGMVGSIVIQQPASFVASNTQAAFVQANAAYTRANNSINANTGGTVTGNLTVTSFTNLGNVTDSYARDTANAAFIQANAAFSVANTGGGGGTDSYARDTANAGFLQANSAYGSQNTTGTYANSAYGQANSAALYANAAFIQANAAYAAANAGGAGTDQLARDTANAAFIQANAAFIQANTGGIQVYATIAELPLSGNDAGDQAYVEENNRLYIWTGVGWFNIALINTNPTITSGPNASYVLAANGTPTVLTLVASDPEGLPITWSYQVTSGSLGSTATIVQSGNVFTITPSTNTDHAGTFGVTFTASDGVNLATAASTFTLSFQPRWDTTTQQAKLIASDYQASDNFGWSVAISGDTVVVGATLEDPNNIMLTFLPDQAPLGHNKPRYKPVTHKQVISLENRWQLMVIQWWLVPSTKTLAISLLLDLPTFLPDPVLRGHNKPN